MIVPQTIVNALSGIAKAFVPSSADKPWYKSKTNLTAIGVAAIGIGATFYPPAMAIVATNPMLVTGVSSAVIGGIFFVLRLVTGGRVTLTNDTQPVTVSQDATAAIQVKE